MLFVICVWPVAAFIILALFGLLAEYGGRGPTGEYLIDLSNPFWFVLSAVLGLLVALIFKYLFDLNRRLRARLKDESDKR